MIKWFEKQIQGSITPIEKFYFFLKTSRLEVYHIDLEHINYMEKFEFIRYVNSIPVFKYKN